MSYPSKSSPHASRIAKYPGRLKSVHLAAVIGVKSLVAFRDAAADDLGGKSLGKRPSVPLPPRYAGRVLWVYTA